LVHADRRTDMTKLVVAFCNFANASKDIKKTVLYNYVWCLFGLRTAGRITDREFISMGL